MVILVCTGGEEPPYSRLQSWIDSCDMTIAADSGITMLKNHAAVADLWIGDGDSLGSPLEGWSAWFSESCILPSDKDDSDTDAAVAEATRRGASEVWLAGGAGGRTDHWWANLRLVERQPLLTRWLTAFEEMFNLHAGSSLKLDAGPVSVFPLGRGPWLVQSKGLRWPLDGVNFETWHSLSNEVEPTGGTIDVASGQVLVLRPFGLGESP